MQRTATVLIALLAVLALAGAAGSFAGVDQPSLQGDEEFGEERNTSRGNGSDPGPPNGTESGVQVDDGGDGPAESSGDGGVSPLFVAVFVGALLAAACLAILLTGDDDRAASPDREPAGGEGPRPTVSLSYGSPDDNAVVRAWTRMRAETGVDDARTPGETARRATEQGLPREAVSRLTDQFRAVRYGDRSVDERRERAARAAMDDIEEEEDEP